LGTARHPTSDLAWLKKFTSVPITYLAMKAVIPAVSQGKDA
jgi:hypothetical protein